MWDGCECRLMRVSLPALPAKSKRVLGFFLLFSFSRFAPFQVRTTRAGERNSVIGLFREILLLLLL